MNRVKKKKRIICFTASCGGHLEELSKLSELFGKNDFLFTEKDRKSTRLNSSHGAKSRMPSSA